MASNPATWPHDTAGLHAGRAVARARMAWPLGLSRDTNFVSWWRGDLVLRHGTQRPAIWRRSAVIREAKVWVAIQFLYRDRRGRRHCQARCDTT